MAALDLHNLTHIDAARYSSRLGNIARQGSELTQGRESFERSQRLRWIRQY